MGKPLPEVTVKIVDQDTGIKSNALNLNALKIHGKKLIECIEAVNALKCVKHVEKELLCIELMKYINLLHLLSKRRY